MGAEFIQSALGWVRETRLGAATALALGILLTTVVVITPLDLSAQTWFAATTIGALLMLRMWRARVGLIILMSLSIIVSARYIYWRATESLSFASPLEASLGLLVLIAEIYYCVVLVLGYIQTVWPLQRRPMPLPADVAAWPTVDIFIPTYNESLDVVRDAVLAAQCIDYPAAKLRVYLCDDGRREEFRKFAAEAGVGYIIRPDNDHVKAGNLNNALRQTSGELIAIFDCDHIPNRAFLQITTGWFLADRALGMLQTPHHFFSPDPMERNLPTGRSIPNEGNLFYGLIQDGNDFWNAAFFCGSCAVLRRSALADVGGFAKETVTEDAHTALKMHKRGWNTAYLRIPLAAGLATERLALHVGQRVRWARGMTQIFRMDNPLLTRGLSFGQRVCYLNAMMHFFFGIPRIIFLLAPIPYLLFNLNIIDASGWMILAYATPHLVHATMTNSRLHGRHRHSFWGEVYENVIAFHIARPTFAALIDPRRGKFNVTEKGGLLPSGYFDLKSVRPHLLVLTVLGMAIAAGAARLLAMSIDTDIEVALLNVGWACHNFVILAAAVAVAREARQVRSYVRIEATVPVFLHFANGRALATTTRNISMGGVLVQASKMYEATPGETVYLEMECGDETGVFECQLIDTSAEGWRLAIGDLPVAQRRMLVRAVMGRADAWLHWDDYTEDRPLRSIWEITRCALSLLRPRHEAPTAVAADPPAALPKAAASAVPTASLLIALVAAGIGGSAQGAEPASAPPAPFPTSIAAAPATMPSAAPGAAGPRREVYTLRDLGAGEPIRLTGASPDRSFPVSVRRDEVITGAKLNLSLAYSPALVSQLSHMHVLLNNELVGSLDLVRERAQGEAVELALNPVLFMDENRLMFRFTGHYTTGCEDPLHSTLWSIISNNSFLQLSIERLPVANDLSLLPQPFFDKFDSRPLQLPFVFAGSPTVTTLQAAGIVASWFGGLAAHRTARFPAVFDDPPPGNVIVFATASERPTGVPLPQIDGPTLSIVENPADRTGKLLLVMGRTPEELRAAARTLTLGANILTGQSATVGAPAVTPRRPYDAPNWIATDRPVRLGELVPPTALQGVGLVPGMLSVNFRTAPDLFMWQEAGVPLRLRYRYPAGDWLDRGVSRLDVSLNNAFVKSLPLSGENFLDTLRQWLFSGYTLHEARITIPPFHVYGQNQLQFYYDIKPHDKGECQSVVPANIQSSIDPDSTIDLSHINRFTNLPNLAFFANSGFPFTRMADLSDTAIVMPEAMTAADIEAFLDLMGFFGDATGLAAANASVILPSAIGTVADKDILVIGSLARQPLVAAWSDLSPLRLENGHLRVRIASTKDRMLGLLNLRHPNEDRESATQVLLAANEDVAGLIGMESPLRPGRAVVMLVASDPDRMLPMINAFRSKELNPQIQGDLALLTGNRIASFRVGDTFEVGYLPIWTKVRWYMADRPVALTVFLLLGVVVLSILAYWSLRRIAEARLRMHGTPDDGDAP